LSSSHEQILQRVLFRSVPSDREREKMVLLSQVIRSKVEEILQSSQIQAEVTLQGSFARDTWISGEADLDIFARFSATMEREEWVEKVLPTIRKGLSHYRVIERYAE